MKGTDYNFPPEWHSMSSTEKSNWFIQERARRQAMRQETTFSRRVEKMKERMERKIEARNGVVIGYGR